LSSVCYRSRDLQHLPPFPTRRSSDLGVRRIEHVPELIPARLADQHRRGFGREAVTGSEPPKHLRSGMLRCLVQRACVAEREDLRDRKSTRLNSSHVKISYAVFCLKKK